MTTTGLSLQVGSQMISLEWDANGKPNYGKLIKVVRETRGISRELLATFYGKELRGMSMTAKAIEIMEEHNQVPVNQERRRVLARLLEIPPVLLGLRSLEDILGAPDISPALDVLQERYTDLHEYSTALVSYWEQSNARIASDSLEAIMQRISHLHRQFPYAHIGSQQQMKRLLCEYHMLIADIAFDAQLNQQALRYLEKAILMATENSYQEAQAAALFRRGNIYFRLGGIAITGNRTMLAERYFTSAIDDYSSALYGLGAELPLHIQGDILLQLGNAQTRIVKQSMKEPLKILDQAERIVYQVQEQEAKYHQSCDSFNLKFTLERYHLDRASAYLGSPLRALRQPQEALDELMRAQEITGAGLARRSAFTSILEARAYLDLKYYPVVVSSAQEALAYATGVNSRVNIARIEEIHQALKRSSYENAEEVIQLGIDIWKAKHTHSSASKVS